MRVDNNKQNFSGIYYTKGLVTKVIGQNGLHFIRVPDKKPPKQLVDIVENSKVLKDLSKDTDIFVTSVHSKQKDGNILGGISISFRDVYSSSKNASASINIAPTEKIKTEKGFWKECADKVGKLKDVLTLKKEANGKEVSFLTDETEKTSLGHKKPFGWFAQDKI